MHCKGLTVVRGTEISEFDVEVIDVVSGEAGEGPRILIRASGPAVDASGIAAGFSGSPVICPDSGGTARNAGAISEGVGDYGNHLALATPIEEMLGEGVSPPSASRRDSALLRSAQPLATPLTVGGLSPRPRKLLEQAARKVGRPLLSAPTGPLGGFPQQDLRPGSSVTAALASGDISLSALGTVTYRDGESIFAFGHPLEGAGARSLFLQDAYIYAVVPNPLTVPELGTGSYKLGTGSGHTVGTVTNDALAAIAGRLGAGPRAIKLEAAARVRGGRSAFLDSAVADERALGLPIGLSVAAPLALAESVDRAVRSGAPITFSTCMRFRIAERERAFGYCNPYFDRVPALADALQAAELVEGYDLTPLSLDRVGVSTRVTRGVRKAELLSGRGPRRIRRGQRIRVRLKLGYPRGERRALTIRFRVPRDAPGGHRTLVLQGTGDSSGDDDELLQELGLTLEGDSGSGPKEPRSLRELVRRVEGLRELQGIQAVFSKQSSALAHRSDRTLFTGRVRIPVVVRR
jgi:hypothetical protein